MNEGPSNIATPPAGEALEPSGPAGPRVDPRARLRQLLAIPEASRSDAVWDELNELEIQLAPINRAAGNPGNSHKRARAGTGAPGGQPNSQKKVSPKGRWGARRRQGKKRGGLAR